MAVGIRQTGRRVAGDERGGMAVMGAVMAMPLTVMAYAAVEYHNVTTARSDLQRAIDAANLAVARSWKNDQAELEALGEQVLHANLSSRALMQEIEDYSVTVNAGVVTSTARVRIKPLIARLIMPEDIRINVSSEVKRTGTKLEVALVLDNSGSMGSMLGSETRLQAMQTAADNFLAQLQSFDDPLVPDDIRIGIVPFAGSVRVDPAQLSANVLDVDGASSVNSMVNAVPTPIPSPLFYSVNAMLAGQSPFVSQPRRLTYFQNLGLTWAGCVESRPGAYGTSDAAPISSAPDSLFTPQFAPDELDLRSGLGDLTSLGTPIQGVAYPNDYLDDGIDAIRLPAYPAPRPLTNDEKAAAYATYWQQLPYVVEKYSGTTLIKTAAAGAVANNTMGPNRGCTIRPVAPLSNNFTALRAMLVNMPLASDTNIPLAVMWGWHVVSPNGPFVSRGKAYGTPNVKKIVVLMTDGENSMGVPGASNLNRSYYGPYGYAWRQMLGLPFVPTPPTSGEVADALNTRMRTICDNMKAAGNDVTVFTIRFAQGGGQDPNLVHCANPSNFYNAAQASQLNAAFQSIAQEISELRIAR